MRKLTFLLALLVLAILAPVSATNAAIETIGPFTGQFFEGFETQQGPFMTELSVFGGQGTVRNLADGPYLHITGYWTAIEVVSARSGICFMGSVGDGVEWIFDTPAGRFGGYFTVLNLTPNSEGAVANFYDVEDSLLAQMDVNAPYSTWTWNGWVSDVPIKRVEIIGFGSPDWFGLGGFVMHDDMEYTPFGQPGTIHYVDADATGNNDGSSWEDAFNYLQDALAVAYYGDEIRVAQGIYKPDQGVGIAPGDREATFQLKNGVTIKGGYAGFGECGLNARDAEKYETILSGDLDGNDVAVNDPCDLWYEATRSENSYHVVTGSGTDRTATLDGFIVTGGNANERSYPHACGGGMMNFSASPTLRNSTFARNFALSGGGMYNLHSNPTLTTCTFNQNSGIHCGGAMVNSESHPTVTTCIFNGNLVREHGGGMYDSFSNPTLDNCTFYGNSTYNYGGGMYNHYSSPRLTNCAFSANSSRISGGAMWNWSRSSPNLTDCTFRNNTVEYGDGGGICNWGGTQILANCTFSCNSADEHGGGIYSDANSSPILTNCTFIQNSARYGNSLAFRYERREWTCALEATNCIFWGRGNEIWSNDNSRITITYSDVQGGYPGEGNIDADPLFIQLGYWDANGAPDDTSDDFWVEGDYRLRAGSPCIDAGTDAGVYEDIDGNIRPFDFPGVDNNGELPDFDMGAYEAVATTKGELTILPWTINRGRQSQRILAVMRLPESIINDDIDIYELLVLFPGAVEAIEQNLIPPGKAAQSSVRIRAVFDKAEMLAAMPDNGDVELTIVGRFKTGQYFYGTDKIRIISSHE